MTDSNETSTEKAIKTAEGMLEKGTFNLVAEVKDRTYPEESVTVSTDFASMHELRKLEEQYNDATTEEAVKLEPRIKELQAVIEKSKLTFRLRGIRPELIDSTQAAADKRAADAGMDEGEAAMDFINEIIALHIVSVTRAEDGAVDERVFTSEDAKVLADYLPMSSWKTIRSAMDSLSFTAAYYAASLSADFLSKS